MQVVARKSDAQPAPVKVLVTGFYDWVDSRNVPAGHFNTTLVNPTGRLIEGNYLKPLLSKVQSHKSGRKLEWDFKVLRVTRHDAKSARFEDYDIVISLGLFAGLPGDCLQLEVNAINEFYGLDVDEDTRVYKQAMLAEGHLRQMQWRLNSIQASLNDALTQLRKQMTSVSLSRTGDASARAMGARLLSLSEMVSSAKLLSVLALRRLTTFQSERSGVAAEEAGAWFSQTGETLTRSLSSYYSEMRDALCRAPRSSSWRDKKGSLLTAGSSFEGSHRLVVQLAEKALTDVQALLWSAETACIVGKALAQIGGSLRQVSDGDSMGTLIKSMKASLNSSRKYGAYTLRENVNDADTENIFVCNATYFHALELVRNRRELGIALSEAYFIHMPPAPLSALWHEAEPPSAEFAERVGEMRTEDEGLKLLAAAVAELIKDLVQ